MAQISIGIDVGNYDTKSQNTNTPSSFQERKEKPSLAPEWVYADGCYFVPTTDRNNQQKDKTENSYCLNTSRFAIAKEVLYQLRNANPGINPKELREKISNINSIVLGVGLPAGHHSALAEKMKKFYMDKWGQGFRFEYYDNGELYPFNFTLESCFVYPQDVFAALFNKELNIPKEWPDYYIIGIGGGTVDLIPVQEGKPMTDKIVTIVKGTRVMYEYIARAFQQETGDELDYHLVENCLLGKPVMLSDDERARVFTLERNYIDELIRDFGRNGADIKRYPCVFVGGGGLLMRDVIEDSGLFARTEFVTDVNVNAKFFAELAAKRKGA